MQNAPPARQPHAVIPLPGEMARRTRDCDWTRTPLGPIERWSPTLLATVNLLLASPLPATLCWGPELVLLYNDAAIPTLAARHPSALGQPFPDVFHEAWHLVGPDIENCLRHGATVVHENVPVSILINDTIEDHYWTYFLVPIYEEGRIAGVYNPHTKTTDAVLAARERDALAARLNQVLDATTDAIVTIDRDWTMTFVNPRARLLYGTGENLIGRNVWQVFPGALYDGSPYVEHYHRAMHERISGDFKAFYPEPLARWLHIHVHPTPDGIVTLSRDITLRKRTEAALLQNEKLAAVGRLASSIAHEINNPLESVTNLLYLANSSTDLPEMHGYLDIAERELRRVSLIANQTLRFHKQSTKATASFCHDLIGGSLSIYQGRLINSTITVEKRKRAQRPVYCFDGEIRQVLTNLVGNAIDAMQHSGGRLLIRSREASHPRSGEPGLVITVADTGTGIPPAALRSIFDPFFTTKGIGGTGLGLWVSQEIVTRHSGTLRVRSSQSPAHPGTVFTLFLPFTAADR